MSVIVYDILIALLAYGVFGKSGPVYGMNRAAEKEAEQKEKQEQEQEEEQKEKAGEENTENSEVSAWIIQRRRSNGRPFSAAA